MSSLETRGVTFRLSGGRPLHNLTIDPEAVTAGAHTIPDIDGLPLPEAAQAYRAADLAVFPWRLVDGGKNLGAFVGTGYHQLSAALTPTQARELAALDSDVTGLGLSAGRSGLVIFDVDDPSKCPPPLQRAIEDIAPPYQTTRDLPATPGQVARGHYVFRTPAGRRIGSPTKWTADAGTEYVGWGEVRSWNSGIAVGPGLHPKAGQGGRYHWARTGPIPELPPYLAVTLPEYAQTAQRATKAEREKAAETFTRRTDPTAIERAKTRHDDGTASGRHGATLNLALTLFREAVAGRITYGDAWTAVHEFFYDLVPDPTRRSEPDALCDWALGQVLSDAAMGRVRGVAAVGVATELPRDVDLTDPAWRARRVEELYRQGANRPIGLADDQIRNARLAAAVAKRVAQSSPAQRYMDALDERLIPALVDLAEIGSPRAGSTEETFAAHAARKAAMEDAAQLATEQCSREAGDEVGAYCTSDGAGVALDRVVHAPWADMDAAALAAAIVTGYQHAASSDDTHTPNLDALDRLPQSRRTTVRDQLGRVMREHAETVTLLVTSREAPENELPQPRPDRQVPICLDTVEYRIDGVNTFLNTSHPDPENAAENGDLFIYQGAPAFYSHRGGHMEETRTINPIRPYELISVTNERANVYSTSKVTGELVTDELTEHMAKVGLSSLRRTLARTLVEVATTPIITAVGKLVGDRTYDPASGILVATETEHEPAPSNPTREQVDAAVTEVRRIFGDFRFVSRGDEAAFYAFLFTVPLRRWLDGDGWTAVPALGIRAGKANAGKTLLSESIGRLHGFTEVRQGADEDEFEKRVLSAYATEPHTRVLLLNNVTNGAVLDSAVLAKIVTESVIRGRKLGHIGKDPSFRNSKIVVVNGNRWRPSDDLVSRTVPCLVKPTVGTEKRTFAVDLPAEINNPAHHAKVLRLLHTVVLGWLGDGAKTGNAPGIRDNFAKWAKHTDGLLTYAGIDGFGGNFSEFAQLEDDRDVMFLGALADHHRQGKRQSWDPFYRPDLERLLAQADDDPDMADGVIDRAGGSAVVTTRLDDAIREALRDSMPRDRSAFNSYTGRKRPLTGQKLSRMLNEQIDLPVEREAAGEDEEAPPTVVLKRHTSDGKRGWRFELF